MDRSRRVVVTGMGVISPVGTGLSEFWESLIEGKSGIREITRFDATGLPSRIAGEVDFEPELYIDRGRGRWTVSQMAVACARMAIEDSGIAGCFKPERAGVIIGTGMAGIETVTGQYDRFLSLGPNRVSPFFIPMMIPNMAAGQISITFGFKGPISAIVTACASGATLSGSFQDDPGQLCRCIAAGGSEAPIVPLLLRALQHESLSTRTTCLRACRPSTTTDGFIGEGAGVLS